MQIQVRQVVCQICRTFHHISDVVPAELVRVPVVDAIVKVHPEWTASGFICLADLNHFRGEYFENLVAAEKGELSALEEEVITSLQHEQDLLSTNLNLEFDRHLTVGERIADTVAEFGGSWSFILSFGVIVGVWIALNSARLLSSPFDPYPYILLNLVLSCVAALQAPIIMMSQNRQEARDRLRAEQEYRVNLKAEIGIRHIIAKLDQLVANQWERLLEIQRLQVELMQDHTRNRRPPPRARQRVRLVTQKERQTPVATFSEAREGGEEEHNSGGEAA